MAVRIQKSAVNIREKLAELENPIGVNGAALMATNTPQEAFGLIGARNRNRIINGDMRIDQRRAGALLSPVPSSTTYLVDRWSIYSGLGSIFRAQQNLNSVTPPPGFTNYLGFQNISTSSSNVDVFTQNIEGFNFSDLGYGTSNAKTLTLSFWMYSSLTGLFGGTFMNYAQTRILPISWNYNSANTWQYVTIQIPGDTSGTWVGASNGGAASLIFCLGGGSVYFSGTPGSWISAVGGTYGAAGQVNLSNSSGATFYITGVQLEEGKIATPFEYRSFGQELALCQRYYETSYAYGTPIGSSLSSTPQGGTFIWSTASNGWYSAMHSGSTRFAVPKRTSAVMRYWDYAGNLNKAGVLYGSSNQSINAGSPVGGASSWGFFPDVNSASSTTLFIYWEASAEL